MLQTTSKKTLPLFIQSAGRIHSFQLKALGNAIDAELQVSIFSHLRTHVDSELILVHYPVCETWLALFQQTQPKVKMVLINGPDDDETEYWYLDKGFDGYFNNHESWQFVARGIDVVMIGELWFKRHLLAKYIKLKNSIKREADQLHGERLKQLSRREIDVYQCLIQGMSNQMIADKLYISIPTVKTHVSNILKKTNVSNRLALLQHNQENQQTQYYEQSH